MKDSWLRIANVDTSTSFSTYMRMRKLEALNEEARNAATLGCHAEYFGRAQYRSVSASDGKTLKQVQGDTSRYCFEFSDLEFSALRISIGSNRKTCPVHTGGAEVSQRAQREFLCVSPLLKKFSVQELIQ